MDRAKKLAAMALRLRHAASAGDWTQVAALDRDIAGLIPQLAQVSGWSAADVEALELLKKVHAEVRERCVHEAARAGAYLARYQEQKGGWIAYALNGASEGSLA
jgi:head-tail adaptor